MNATRAPHEPLYPRHGNGEVPVVVKMRRCHDCRVDVSDGLTNGGWVENAQGVTVCGGCFWPTPTLGARR